MKQALVMMAIILVLGFIGYRYLESGGKGTVSYTISERAKEYLQGRKDSNDERWRRIELNNDEYDTYKTGTLVKIDDCFSIKVPFPMTEARKESDCSYRVFLADPKGYIVVYQRAATGADLKDIPDVRMRRLYTDQYKEAEVRFGSLQFLTFRRAGTEYEKTAFLLNNGKLYVLSFIVPTNEDLDDQFNHMLSSVRFIMK